MKTKGLFSRNYTEARQKFLGAAEAANAITESIQNPCRGPVGERLYVDTAWIGPSDASRVLVIISGTHGAEGLCGSGVQVGTLKDRPASSLPANTAILLIHAINPFGFSWMRRATEEGVDLCRNFLDFDQALPENTVYDELIDAIVPTEWEGEIREKADARIAAYVGRQGMESYLKNIALGQYKYWYAPFFGGEAPTWSNRTLHKIIKKHLVHRSDVAAIDYHTGLGPYGHGELLSFHKAGSESLARARQWWGDCVTSVFNADETVAYPLTGGLLTGFENALPKSRFTAGAYEFGTVDVMSVLDSMRADHWLHTYGDLDSELARAIKQNMYDTYFGDTNKWRDMIWEQSNTAHGKALENL